MTRRKRTKARLAPGHGWRAQRGHAILVLGRGAVRVEVPEGWDIEIAEDCVKARDRKPPDDECVLALSFHRWPAVAGRALTVGSLVRSSLEADERKFSAISLASEETRIDIDLAWAQGAFVDPRLDRAAFGRLCIARKGEIQALVTFDFWADDLARCDPLWHGFLDSLQLGQWVADPLRGPTLS